MTEEQKLILQKFKEAEAVMINHKECIEQLQKVVAELQQEIIKLKQLHQRN